MILSVSSFGENISGRVRERLPGPARTEQISWAQRSLTPAQSECKICKHQKGVSCCTVIGLILVDLVTLIILFYGYNKLRQFHEGERKSSTDFKIMF